MDPPAPTCFAFTRGVKVVVGAQQLALSVRPAVVDARRQVGAHVHLGRDVGARLESGGVKRKTGGEKRKVRRRRVKGAAGGVKADVSI